MSSAEKFQAPIFENLSIGRRSPSLGMVIVLAVLMSAIQGFSLATTVWTTGYFGDTDDALRMVQVRDFLAGQAWYDLNVHRLNPPEGLLIHWSRIVDVPLAVLVRFAEIFFPPQQAELLARLLFPLFLLTALFLAVARTARVLLGESAVIPAIVLCVFTGPIFQQFQPGRVDHHSPQIVLLVFMLCMMLEAMRPGRAFCAAIAAGLAAISLGISVENLPFIIVMSALLPFFWIFDPGSMRRPLLAFGTGLVVAIPIVFAATIAPSRWGVPVCDALSSAYAAPALVGAAGCILIGAIQSPASRGSRLVWICAIGALAALSMLLIHPQCFRGPLEAVDPLLKSFWLDKVSEARPLLSVLTTDKSTALVVVPALLCAASAAWPLIVSSGEKRKDWTIVVAFLAIGVITTFWQVRASSSLTPLAIMPATWLILQFRQFLIAQNVSTATVLSLALVIPLSPLGWATAAAALPNAGGSMPELSEARKETAAESCFKRDDYTVASQLPAGLVLAPIDVGAHMLAFTHHRVLAAAYHRNNSGNRKALDALFAKPDEAQQLVLRTGADFVAICMVQAELDHMRSFAPEGLASALTDGHVPDWLDEVSPPKALLRLYRVRSGAGLNEKSVTR